MSYRNAKSVASNIEEHLSQAKLSLHGTQIVATSVVPIPGMGPVTTTLIGLIDKLMEKRSNHIGLDIVSHEVLHLVGMIDRTMSRVKHRIREIPTYDSPQRGLLVDPLNRSSKLENLVMKLFNDLTGLKKKADKLSFHWIYTSRDATTLKELWEGIVNCKKYFELECQVAIEASIEEVLEIISSIEEKVANVKEVVAQEAAINSYDRDEKTLESLPYAEADYRAAGNAMKSNFLPGTRVELFDVINDWVQWRSPEVSGKAVCILTGGAGTGKSTIASEFARQRDNEGDYGASFFFVHGVADFESTRLVFPTLAHQLAQSQEALRPHIVRAAREHLKRGKVQQMRFQAPSLLYRPVHDVGCEHPMTVLIIDALDECSEETRNCVPEMLDRLIETVHQAQFPLRIFLTSRPNPLIENTLQSSQWASLVHTISLHDLSPESIQRDMAIFIRDGITKIPSGQALLQQRPDVADRLAERAGRLFIYAKIVMDFLCDNPGVVEDGLDEFLSEGSSQLAAALKPLDDYYLTVLEIAFRSSDLSSDPALCQALESTLGSLAVLRTPLSLAVLEALTGIPRKDICNVLGRLRALVLFDEAKPDEAIRAMHPTFPQFLLDANRCMSPWYRVDAPRQHARLAAGCLCALDALEENMCCLPNPAVPRADILDLAERLGTYVPEHVQYACAHWAAHLGDACELGKKHIGTACWCIEIREQLGAFARTKLGVWVEIMSYMGRLDTVEAALGAARGYLKGSPLYQEVDALFAGAQQLVVDHYSKIEECPYDVHQPRSIPDAFSSSLEWGDDGSVEEALGTAPVHLKYQEVDALLVGAQQLVVNDYPEIEERSHYDHESFLSSASVRSLSTKTVLNYANLVEDDLDASELVSKGSSQHATTRQPIDDLTVSGTPFPSKDVSQSPWSDQAPPDAASHTQHPRRPQEPSSVSGSSVVSAGISQYVPYSMGRYWQISENHRFAYTLESANYGWYRQMSSEE